MLEVELVSPDGFVAERFDMADGMTLEQAARTINPDSEGKFAVPTIALVGTKPAVRDLGDWNFPLSGAKIQFRQLAMGGGGGGSNAMQMVLQIAIIAAAVAAATLIPGAAFFEAGGTIFGLGGTFWGAMAGAGIMMLGTMLMGALFQQKLPQGQLGAMGAEQASPTYSINSSGNQARLYQTEPELFGRMKIVPDFVANTWTEYIDNDQIGYFVYAVGRGYYEIESLQFGETVFWRNGQFVADSGYEIMELEIVEPDNPVTIFPDNIITSTEVNGQQLFGPNEEEYEGAIGPYAANPPGTFTNRISLDFVFQQGLGYYNDKGQLQQYSVWWDVYAQKIDDFGEPLGAWRKLETIKYTGATLTPQRLTRSYAVENGRYLVRVNRTSDHGGGGQYIDTLVWAGMKAMLPGTYKYPITCVAFSVRANNALTQSASRQFSIIATRKLPLYNRQTKTWSDPVPTRSWAAAVSHVCKAEWGGRLTDADIDLDTLWAIEENLQAKGWHYDSYIDGAYLVWTLLCEMCQSQCVIPRLIGPILSFVQDGPDRTPVFALTPRNIVRNTFAVNYVTWSEQTPDDVTLEYLDADFGFQQRDVTAILPESESQEPSSLDILGITNRDHAHKVAVAYAAHNRWQRIKVECQVEALGRIINQGDICTVAHPRFKNTESGIVTGWQENTLAIGLKRDIYGKFEDGEFYIALVRQDGSIWGPCKLASLGKNEATLDSADYATLLLQGQGNPFEWLTLGRDRQPTAWTLYSAKTYQRLMVVDSVQAQDALHYNLSLLNYDGRIYSYDLPVPIWQGRGQLPDESALPAPKCLRGTVETENALTLSWLAVPGAKWYEVQSSTDAQYWQNCGRTNDCSMLLMGEAGQVYARVRAGNDQRTSIWASWHGDTLDVPPSVPQPRLVGEYSGASAYLTWPKIADAESYVVTLRNQDNIAIYTATQTGNFFQVTPEIQTGGPYRSLKVQVAARNEAGTSSAGSLELSDPAPEAPKNLYYMPGVFSFGIIAQQIPEKATGVAIVYGSTDNFGINDVTAYETRQEYSGNLGNVTQAYFRLAFKDAFYDAFPGTSGLLQLNWSKARQV